MADATSKRCFVVSPIGAAGSSDRKHADMLLHGIIRPVLSDELKYEVKRADGFAAPDIITATVIDCLMNWEIVIADLSFSNPNVFYEIGLRHMASKPVVHMALEGTTLPFDTAAQRTIFFDPYDWHSQEKSRQQLRETVKEVLRPEYRISNPVTHAVGLVSASISGDTGQQVLANFEARLTRLESAGNRAESRVKKYASPFESFKRRVKNWVETEEAVMPVSLFEHYLDQYFPGSLKKPILQEVADWVNAERPMMNYDEVWQYLIGRYDLIPF